MKMPSSARRAAMLWFAAASLASAACSPAEAVRTQRKPPIVQAEARAATVRSDDLGRFVVTGVLIDPVLDNMQQRYFEHDPRFLHRLVTIEPRRLFIDTDSPCTQITRRWTKRTLAVLLRARSQRRNASAARGPVPADYGLASAPKGPLAMADYGCTGPDTARSGGIPGKAWSGVVGWSLGGGRRALLWENEVILLLRPLAAPPKPQASFPCDGARSPAERAICADLSLANWDRSVAAAYALNLRGSIKGEGWQPVEDPATLEDSQRRWLAERDRCGADRECLLDSMSGRTDALMRRQY